MGQTESAVELLIPELPESVESVLSLRDELGRTPEGGAAMMVLALLLIARDPDGHLGWDALTLCVDRARLVASPQGYKGWGVSVRDRQHTVRQLRAQPWAPDSYLAGSTPEGGYALPLPPYRVAVLRNPYSGDEASGRVKVFVVSSGAATPRPVTLLRNDAGLWKASEWSSLTMGVVPPVAGGPDEL